jgi:hypothetical protein
MEPIEQIVLAQDLDVHSWIRPACDKLSRRNTSLSLEEARTIGLDTAVEVFHLREHNLHCMLRHQSLTFAVAEDDAEAQLPTTSTYQYTKTERHDHKKPKCKPREQAMEYIAKQAREKQKSEETEAKVEVEVAVKRVEEERPAKEEDFAAAEAAKQAEKQAQHAKDEATRLAKEEANRLAKEEADRLAREEANRLAKEEEANRVAKAEEEAKQQEALKEAEADAQKQRQQEIDHLAAIAAAAANAPKHEGKCSIHIHFYRNSRSMLHVDTDSTTSYAAVSIMASTDSAHTALSPALSPVWNPTPSPTPSPTLSLVLSSTLSPVLSLVLSPTLSQQTCMSEGAPTDLLLGPITWQGDFIDGPALEPAPATFVYFGAESPVNGFAAGLTSTLNTVVPTTQTEGPTVASTAAEPVPPASEHVAQTKPAPTSTAETAQNQAEREAVAAALKEASDAAEVAEAEKSAAAAAVKAAEDALADASAPLKRAEEATKAWEAEKNALKRARLGTAKRKATDEVKAAGPKIRDAEAALKEAQSRLEEAEGKVSKADEAKAAAQATIESLPSADQASRPPAPAIDATAANASTNAFGSIGGGWQKIAALEAPTIAPEGSPVKVEKALPTE